MIVAGAWCSLTRLDAASFRPPAHSSAGTSCSADLAPTVAAGIHYGVAFFVGNLTPTRPPGPSTCDMKTQRLLRELKKVAVRFFAGPPNQAARLRCLMARPFPRSAFVVRGASSLMRRSLSAPGPAPSRMRHVSGCLARDRPK